MPSLQTEEKYFVICSFVVGGYFCRLYRLHWLYFSVFHEFHEDVSRITEAACICLPFPT